MMGTLGEWLFRGTVLALAMVIGAVLISKCKLAQSREQSRLMWLLFVVPFASGGFYTVIAAVCGCYCVWFLIGCYRTRKALYFYANDTIISIVQVVLAYVATIIWAANRGMAAVGAARYIPLLFYAVALMQLSKEELSGIMDIIPLGGAVMMVLSFPLQYVPALSSVIVPYGRLSGFFEYSNTFALYLLLGLTVQVTKARRSRWDYLLDLLLIAGVFYSGSRTSFALMVLILVVACVLKRDKRFIVTMGGLFAGCILITVFAKNSVSAGRYLTTSVQDSSFLSRILYFKDAVQIILSHPFGLGYMGYAAIQGSVQTGVYSVTFVHNELLQTLMDIGWIPTLLFCVALFRAFFAKGADARKRLMMFVLLAHCMMDFDLQYLSIWLILIPMLGLLDGKRLSYRGGVLMPGLVSSAVLVFCLWLGVGDALYYMGENAACLRVVPFHTLALEHALTQTAEPDELDALADRVLALNPYSSIAYSARANAAFSNGDIAAMIEAKEQAIACNRYSTDEYIDYFDKLYVALQLYDAQGDQSSVVVCQQKLLEIPNMLSQVLDGTTPLAWKLQHTPELELPEEYQSILEVLKE